MSSATETPARDVARDALVSAVIVYGVQAVVLLGLGAAISRRYWLDHARWQWQQWRTRADRAESAALAEVRRDISRLEHGDTMPPGGQPETGLYGGLG